MVSISSNPSRPPIATEIPNNRPYFSAIYNKIWLFGGHDKKTDVVEVFDTIKGVSFDTNIHFNSTQGMKYPSSVIINLP